MRRRLIAFSALACCLSGVVASAGGPSWSVAESGPLRVITDDSPAIASALLDDLALIRAMLWQMTSAEPSVPLRVLAVRDHKPFMELTPSQFKRGDFRTFGFSHAGPNNAFIALRIDRPAPLTADTLRHEYIHVVTSAQSPDAPAWLDEGLSEFWGAMVIDGGRVVAGRAVAKHVALLHKRKWLPLDAVVKRPRGSLPASSDQIELFYAQAWAMVHYLLLGRNGDPLTTFMPPSTLPAGLDEALHRYIERAQFRETSLPWQPSARAASTASTISDARALAERAAMLVSSEQPRAAVPLARQALALDPNQPMALEAMGTYYFLDNQPQQARQWLTRALATGTTSYGASLSMALLSASAAERERYLMVAIAARPDSEVAWQRLGAAFMEDGRLDAARRWCRTWWTRRPAWLPIVQVLPCG